MSATPSQDRPWLKHYPPGVPADIELNRYSSLPAMAEEAFAKYADRPAVTCHGQNADLSRT